MIKGEREEETVGKSMPVRSFKKKRKSHFSHEKRFCLFLSFALFVGIGMWVPNMILHAMIISCSCNLECCDAENIIRQFSQLNSLLTASDWLTRILRERAPSRERLFEKLYKSTI